MFPQRQGAGDKNVQTDIEPAGSDREDTTGGAMSPHRQEPSSGATLYERNDNLVKEEFLRGEFDFVEGVGEISETDFFRMITQKAVLKKLASTYPSPHKKHDVPTWVYIASDISMRFNGVHNFYAFPYVVRSGGMVQAFGPAMGHKAVHPQTGDVSLSCEGFNNKNDYDRQTPCDQDYLRKMARQTDAKLLQTWFNKDVVGIFKEHHAFDEEGIFIGDATYLFVPDNSSYEGSSLLLFDESNHPVESKELTDKQKARCVWRRCYKLVSLIHINRAQEFFLYAGLEVTPGKDHESPILYRLVEQFIQSHGLGIMKRLILDRGFLDGPEIGRLKQEWGINVLIPVRSNMDIYKDVVGLAEGGMLEFKKWVPPMSAPPLIPMHRPEHIRKREEARQRTLRERKAQAGVKTPADSSKVLVQSEVACVRDLQTFSTCPIALNAVINRETYSDGHHDYWVLLDTGPVDDPAHTRQEYTLRAAIEERHRQLKCFSDLEAFSSRCFSLIVNQVVFVLLTYSLLQWYLLRVGRKDLCPKTPMRTRELLRPTNTVIIMYHKNYVAHLTPLDYMELTLSVDGQAKIKILAKTRKLRRESAHQLNNARPP